MIINVDLRDFLNISNDDEKTAKVPSCQKDYHEYTQVIATEECTDNISGNENQCKDSEMVNKRPHLITKAPKELEQQW